MRLGMTNNVSDDYLESMRRKLADLILRPGSRLHDYDVHI